ncbi:hypothetical protein [Hymenobacter radiodurans]|nr:hypothetical protein [Hymenobacter radiodurans]
MKHNAIQSEPGAAAELLIFQEYGGVALQIYFVDNGGEAIRYIRIAL